MRHITKGPEPATLLAWKGQANPDWQPTYAALQNPEKAGVFAALLADQGNVCCYCGARVEGPDAGGSEACHVEHIVPQSADADLALTWSNMVASCQGTSGLQGHCGQRRQNWYDAGLFVSPLDPACASAFRSHSSGMLAASPDPAWPPQGDAMICHLCLNDEALARRRRLAVRNHFGDIDLDSRSAVQAEIAACTAPGADGAYTEFGDFVAEVLASYI